MANKVDYIVSLAVEGSAYSAALKKASSDAARFKRDNESLGAVVGKLPSAFKALGAAVSAGAVAYKAFNTAITDSQKLADEWARTIKSAESAWEGFISALSNGSLSDYIRNFDAMISKARELADIQDRLSTVNIFASGEKARYMRGIQEARATLSNGNASASERASAEASLASNIAKLTAIVNQSAQAQEDAAKAMISSELANKGYTGAVDMSYFQSLGSYDQATAIGGAASRLANQTYIGGKRYVKGLIKNTAYSNEQRAADLRLVENLTPAQQQFFAALSEISDEKLQQIVSYLSGADNERAQLAQVTRRANSALASKAASFAKSAKSEVVSGSIGALEADLAELKQRLKNAVTDEAVRETRALIAGVEEMLNERLGRDSGNPDSAVSNAVATSPKSIAAGLGIGKEVADVDAPLGVNWESQVSGVNSMIASVGSLAAAFASVSGAAANSGDAFIAVTSSISQVLTSIGGLISAYGAMSAAATGAAVASAAATAPPFTKIATAISTAATLIGLMGTIKGAMKFADGGVVGGTSFSGDRLTARVNSGEMILNQAEQANLFRMAQSGTSEGRMSAAYITGDTIYMALSNYMSRTGKRL